MGTFVDFIVVTPAECPTNGGYVDDVLYPGQEQAQRVLELRREELAFIQSRNG